MSSYPRGLIRPIFNSSDWIIEEDTGDGLTEVQGNLLYVKKTGDESIIGNKTFTNDVIINGQLTANATTINGQLNVNNNITLRTSGTLPISGQLGFINQVSISDTNLTSGIISQVASVSVPYGTYIVAITVQFRTEAPTNWLESAIHFGTISANIPTNSPWSVYTRFANISIGGIAFRNVSLTRVLQVNATTTYFLNCLTNFTSATSMRVNSGSSAIQLTRIA
jgi:hypothetical protein